MHVLRLTSVFEPPPGALEGAGARLDPIGGMQSHTGALTRALDALGVRQTVVTAHRPGAGRAEPFGGRSRVLRLGVPVPFARQGWALPAAAAALRTARTADVVHAHLGEDLAVLPLALAAARTAGIPLVVSVHMSMAHTADGGAPLARLRHALGGRAERRVVPRADAVLVLTRRMAARLIDEGIAPERVRVVPSGVPAGMFHALHRDPLPGLPRPRIVFAGRLAEQKDPLALVEAAARLRADAHVVFVGDGPLRDAVERRAAQLGLAGRLTVTGFVPRAQVAAHLAHADVLALPSRYEELGTALVEALAAGVPVVASDTGGIPEVVEHGETGLLAPPGDPAALAAALDALLADPQRRARMAAAARGAAQRYRWEALAGEVLAAYRAVLGEPAPAAPPAGRRPAAAAG